MIIGLLSFMGPSEVLSIVQMVQLGFSVTQFWRFHHRLRSRGHVCNRKCISRGVYKRKHKKLEDVCRDLKQFEVLMSVLWRFVRIVGGSPGSSGS